MPEQDGIPDQNPLPPNPQQDALDAATSPDKTEVISITDADGNQVDAYVVKPKIEAQMSTIDAEIERLTAIRDEFLAKAAAVDVLISEQNAHKVQFENPTQTVVLPRPAEDPLGGPTEDPPVG